MLKTHLVLVDELKSYRNPAMKIIRIVKDFKLIGSYADFTELVERDSTKGLRDT